MPKIRGRFHEVRAWNGIPGMDVDKDFATMLGAAGIPVTAYTRREAKTRKVFAQPKPRGGFLQPVTSPGPAVWGAGPAASAGPIRADDVEETEIAPAVMGYRVATPLAACQPDAEIAIWAAEHYEPEELQVIYRLQERGTWQDYLRGVRAAMETEDQSE